MAPLNLRSFDLSRYLESLTLKEREELSHPYSQITKRDKTIREPGPWAIAYPSPSVPSVGTGTVQLQTRDIAGVTKTPDHGGAMDPNNINMRGVQAAIAIICCGMVVGAIWFFFWAKNGGFQWRRGDWDEYKSTVLRRKGPNGTTLSNATKSTRLGGGSVVGDGYSDRDTNTYADDISTVHTGTMTELSSSTAPIIKEKQGAYTGDKRSRKQKARQSAKERKQREMQQAAFEGAHDADVRAYMEEKPARVGGINAHSDTLHYGTDYTDTEGSAYSASQHRPTSHYQATVPPAVPQHQRQPPRDTRNSRRDFSYTIGGQQEHQQFSVASSQRSPSPPPMRVPARYAQKENTKTYHHPLPNLRGGGAGLSTQSPGGNKGFRRGAGGDFDD